MSTLGNRRNGRRPSVLEMLPSFVTPDQESDETAGFNPRKKNRGWRVDFNRETLREMALVLVGLLIVAWLFLGGSSAPSQSTSWAGRPLVMTESPIIVPSIGGSGREGVKKAPGDMHLIQAEDSRPQSGGKVPVYVYSGAKAPAVVVVTVIDDARFPSEYTSKIVENRIEYARAHDYGVFIRYAKDFLPLYEESNSQSPTWAQVAISREAMAAFPKSKAFWYIDQSALIMNPLVDVEKEFLDPSHLEPKMLANARVIRESDNGQTLAAPDAKEIDLITTRDDYAITPVSYIYKNNVLSKSLLETWMDPLYRVYNQFYNSREALMHILKWHSTYLNHMAVVSPRLLASYAVPPQSALGDELGYKDGDFAAVFKCDYNTESCKKDFQMFWNGRGRVAASSPAA